MSHMRIPKEWTIQRSTPFFTKQTVPAALLTHHNTAQGVFGQLCVMEGTVTYYGFTNEEATEAELVVVITAGQFAT
ncbi:cytoplasmic protein, partial [Vibrio vulnificus]